MLCVFQVNHGEFLTISDEIQPTSRVRELTVALSRYHGIAEDKQVLLAHDGRLLEHQQMIGAYGVGTETMPILLYDMSLIKGETRRQPAVVAELGESYAQALDMMKQSNNDMKQQIALAKKLATSCDVLSEKCVRVVKEQELQLQGWNAAVANSNTVLGSFIQQVKTLKEGANAFTKSKAEYQRLLDNFPLVLGQLKQMIIPNQLLGEHDNSHPVTLLEWIGTHDQSSTLSELAKECKSALESQGEERTQRVISDAEFAIESIPDQSSALEKWKGKMASDDRTACLKRVCTLAEDAKDFVKKLVATSERALKSGDKLVVKELTTSNWKTLSMMSKQHSEIQSLVNECISYKEQLTSELNQQLKLVSEVQTKVSDSERNIPLLKERIRRITHRFTILGQISEAPKILASAIAEIIRRRRFHEQFVKLTEETCEHFSKIRNTEIQEREKFFNGNSKHFLAQLYHQALNDRPPNVNSPLRRPFDQQLPDITGEEVHQVMAVVSSELQQLLKSAMNFTVEHCTSVADPHDEVDCSMYTSASDNDHLVKEITKLEAEKKKLEQEVEELKIHNQKLLDLQEALEKKLDGVEEEKMVEVRLEKQIEYMTDQQNSIEESGEEEKLDTSNKLEEKGLTMQATLDYFRTELDHYKLKVKEKEELLQEEIIKSKEQELKNAELLRMQEEKDTLLDSQAKSIVELTNKFKMSVENMEYERYQKSAAEIDKESLEENLKELKAELSEAKATCEHLKLSLEKQEKDKLDQLKLINQEKDLELSKVENETRKQLVELQSTISNLRDKMLELTTGNSLMNDTIKKLKTELEEKTVHISDLELSITDLKSKLRDTSEKHFEMERNYKSEVAEKEKVILELTTSYEALNQKLEAETSKFKHSEQEIDKLTTALKNHEENRAQLEAKIAELEMDMKKSNKTVDTLTLQLKDAREKVLLADEMQARKIEQYESDISLTKETKNKEIESLSLQLKEYIEKSKTQDKQIIQYQNDISLIKETNSKEFEKKDAAIEEKERTIEKLKEQNSSLENDINKWQKKCMEVERDLKVHERMLEKNPSGKFMWLSSTSSRDMVESNSTAIVPTPSRSEAFGTYYLSVKLFNLQVGDYAIFMPDKYSNYLAVTADGKDYYLDKKSASTFTVFHELPCKSKMLIGKVSDRVYCEVKKDNNRLRVPLGSKVYRLTADEWKPPS